jgi:hypothetical protein
MLLHTLSHVELFFLHFDPVMLKLSLLLVSNLLLLDDLVLLLLELQHTFGLLFNLVFEIFFLLPLK